MVTLFPPYHPVMMTTLWLYAYGQGIYASRRIYQQTFIDTYSKVGFAKLYDRKTPVTAAERLNDRVLAFFEQHEIPLSRVLTDRGTKYCGDPERHEDELYLGRREHRSHTHEIVRTSGVALLQGDKSPSPEE